MREGQADRRTGEGTARGVEAYGPHQSAGYWVQRLARSMREHFERRLAEHDLTFGLWPILGAVHGGDAATPSEVAQYLGVDRSAMTRQLDRLEASGLLVRRRCESDRRSVSLELTEKGQELVPQLADLSRETNERFLQGLTEGEAQAFLDVVRKMLRNADGDVRRLW